MAHETPTVIARKRDRLGSRYAQRIRRDGRLPAVIYGHRTDPIHVSLDEKETLGHLRHGSHVLNVQIEGGTAETCLVKDLQFGYLGDNLIHLDLARVDLDEEVSVGVHLHFIGTPEAARKPGAIVHHAITELPVICRVRDIPEEIRVDLSKMGETLFAREIALPEGVRLDIEADDVITRIELVLDAAEGEAAAVEGSGTQPEVITERKVDEADGDKKEKKG
ncbi:MAG TPA: 50S ribosomal protein L25 [Phycisphaerales bacterium]|nr:50S ribosomal protein L25 [Phycisphaerales bacterium]HMP37633.1 50S ribosomal protein L25 [Phycisphaerales bacterium]